MKISVCGLGAISAIGDDVEQMLCSVKEGKGGVGKLSLFESVVDVPVGEVKLSNTTMKSMVGVHKNTVISRTALLGMIAAKSAVVDAQIPSVARVGLISSTSVGGMDLTEEFYRQYRIDNTKGRISVLSAHDCADSTNKIAEYCNIDGFTTTISTACSSGANAIMLGANLLKRNMLDYVVVGATDSLCRFTLNGFNSLMILDKNECRPFSSDRAGLNLGEGAGYLVLTNKENASKHYCYLSGYANSNDAYHQTASSENGDGAYLAMKQAIESANIGVSDISYINAHGTGTGNNDLSESRAIKRVFGKTIPMFSSTKQYTGHTLAAAGAIGAVLSIKSMEKGLIIPNLGFENVMSEIGLMPQTEVVEGVDIRNIMTNSFGFGGNCSTLIFSK